METEKRNLNSGTRFDRYHAEYPLIPEHTLQLMMDYGYNHLPVLGGFLESFFANDMFKAHAHADFDNRRALTEMVYLVYNRFPADCHGSYDMVAKWLTPK